MLHSFVLFKSQPLPSGLAFQQVSSAFNPGDGASIGLGLGDGVASLEILALHWFSVAKRMPLKHSLAGRIEHSVPLGRTFQQLIVAAGAIEGDGLGDGETLGLGDGLVLGLGVGIVVG